MSDLATRLGPLTLQNPVLLASGTAAYGRELADVMDLEAMGGFVTKAVSREPRPGAPARAHAGAPTRRRKQASRGCGELWPLSPH